MLGCNYNIFQKFVRYNDVVRTIYITKLPTQLSSKLATKIEKWMLGSNVDHTRHMYVVSLKLKVNCFSLTVSLSKRNSIVINYLIKVLPTLILIYHIYFLFSILYINEIRSDIESNN